MGAVHSAELPYQLPHFSNTTRLDGPDLKPASQLLATQMLEFCTSFAAAGVPRARGVTAWAKFQTSSDVMRLDPGKVGPFDADAEHNCRFWHTLYPEILQ
jgi:para-nitrobenzyl esterase